MTQAHPSYGKHAGSNPFHHFGRWIVTGTDGLWAQTVELAVEEGLSPQEVMARDHVRPAAFEHVAAIQRIHSAYLARTGQVVAN